MIILVILNLVAVSTAFQCYTCNDEPHDDDTNPCRDMMAECLPSVSSCSMLVYRTAGKTHTRKFCTPKNTPLYQYLQLLPGSSICQNVNSVIENTMMNNLPKQRLPKLEEEQSEPLPPASGPPDDILMQMADAGF